MLLMAKIRKGEEYKSPPTIFDYFKNSTFQGDGLKVLEWIIFHPMLFEMIIIFALCQWCSVHGF